MSGTWSGKRTPVRDKVVRARRCVICRKPYTPRWVEQRSCGGRCARVLGGRSHDGLPIGFAQQIEKRKAAHKAAVQRECAARWQELSVREIEIFTYAVRIGYNRGYSRGLHSKRRREKAVA